MTCIRVLFPGTVVLIGLLVVMSVVVVLFLLLICEFLALQRKADGVKFNTAEVSSPNSSFSALSFHFSKNIHSSICHPNIFGW